MSIKKDFSKGVIINRMYAGSYLHENIGHEVINLKRADNDEFYVYINPYGTVSKEALNFEQMLLVRLAGKDLFEVIGLAEGLEPAACIINPGKQTKENFDYVLKAQKDYINKQKGVSYGGVNIMDIFGKASLQDIYISFKAKSVKEPKEDQRIFLHYTKSKNSKDKMDYSHLPGVIIELTQNRWPRMALKTYITPSPSESNVESDYEKLIKRVIGDKSLWKEKPVEKVGNISPFKKDPISLFSICDIEDNENCISNALTYFMNQSKYKGIWKEFFNKFLRIELSDNFKAFREVNIKIKADKNARGRIDILIVDENNTIVIENKIKSGINKVSSDNNDTSQLTRYFNYIREAEEYKDKNHGFCILYPNYNVPKIKDGMDEKYEKISYSDLYNFLQNKGIKEIVESDFNFNALKDLFKRHCNHTPNGYLRDEMMEKFKQRINDLKQK